MHAYERWEKQITSASSLLQSVSQMDDVLRDLLGSKYSSTTTTRCMDDSLEERAVEFSVLPYITGALE
jgi:hypothetical protein